ncbi:MAG: hypothetical protein QG556_207 [Pseudomonadota bacterium]|nr:hypothetical protein [Pseudomonadota bacterium]
MNKLWFFLMVTFFCWQSYAFLYPEYRQVRPGIILQKHKYCAHDCWNQTLLNQHDAYRCSTNYRIH